MKRITLLTAALALGAALPLLAQKDNRSATPLKLPAVGFGLGTGGGAHAPNEWYLIDSVNPKVAGLDESAMFYVDYLYDLAAMAKAGR